MNAKFLMSLIIWKLKIHSTKILKMLV